MQLKEFISDSLVSIVEGIKEVQNKGEIGGLVAPTHVGGHEFSRDSGVLNQERIISTVVKFDIAVVIAKEGQTSGKAGIRIAGIGAGIEGELSDKNSSVSRIQFSVPLIFPQNPQKWHEQ